MGFCKTTLIKTLQKDQFALRNKKADSDNNVVFGNYRLINLTDDAPHLPNQ